MSTWTNIFLQDKEEIHVLPVNDLRDHEETADCWCRPRREDDAYGVIIHNSMDRREEYENGRAKH